MKAALIDDERMARRELRRLLSAHPEIEIAGEAANGDEALALIEKHEPDLIFLDIEMPGMTGFDLLGRLRDVPEVIFTTAYDQYALKAFEVNALDYLLKPIAPERLAAALQKVRGRQPQFRDQIFMRDGDRCWIVCAGDIEILESEGNYTRVFFRNERPLIAGSLAAFEQRLASSGFFRASRKHVINLNNIQSTEWEPGGNLLVTMRCGEKVPLSRRQSAELRKVLAI
ncbi:MAG TPA: response regulator [Terriglobia bacterium]|jgi:two-component system LytT family response regulator